MTEYQLQLAAKRLGANADYQAVFGAFLEMKTEQVFNVEVGNVLLLQTSVMIVHALRELETYLGELAKELDKDGN